MYHDLHLALCALQNAIAQFSILLRSTFGVRSVCSCLFALLFAALAERRPCSSFCFILFRSELNKKSFVCSLCTMFNRHWNCMCFEFTPFPRAQNESLTVFSPHPPLFFFKLWFFSILCSFNSFASHSYAPYSHSKRRFCSEKPLFQHIRKTEKGAFALSNFYLISHYD